MGIAKKRQFPRLKSVYKERISPTEDILWIGIKCQCLQLFQDPNGNDMWSDDASCQKLLADQEALALIDNTQVASDVDYKKYQVIFFPGQFPFFSKPSFFPYTDGEMNSMV